MTTIKLYLQYLKRENYPELFGDECDEGFLNIEKQFGELCSDETIQEVHLSQKEKACDYSICMKCDHEHIKEYWMELDGDACRKSPIPVCWFVDASSLKPGVAHEWLYEKVLPKMLSKEEGENLRPMIEKVISLLEGRSDGLYQIGVMEGRGQRGLRIFTSDMKRSGMKAYLEALSWSGNMEILEMWLEKLESLSERNVFILDFDVYPDGISKKIGINFGSRNKKDETIEELLDFFAKENLALDGKVKDVMRWIKRAPSHVPFIQNDISHFKLPFDGEKILDAKAYLRQGSVCYKPFKIFERPYIMNLELTSRCPLRCPQCYCDLEKGKELSLEDALYWIEEAARENVKIVNLSGGETMCYPHIFEIVEAVSKRGMTPNIAVSGYHFDKEEARR